MSCAVVKFVSASGTVHEVPYEYVKGNELVDSCVELDEDCKVHLPSVSDTLMTYLTEFIIRNAEESERFDPDSISLPIQTNNIADLVPAWCVEYLERVRGDVIELLRVADHMAVIPLLRLLCLKVATAIKGKTADEVAQALLPGPVANPS